MQLFIRFVTNPLNCWMIVEIVGTGNARPYGFPKQTPSIFCTNSNEIAARAVVIVFC